MSAPSKPRPIGRLFPRLRIRWVLRKARIATHSQSDRIAYAHDAWLIRHPEAPLSTNDDYPGFAEHIAAREAANRQARNALKETL
jgi:hypothetical protein